MSNPFLRRHDILKLYEPLVGSTMLELGNKTEGGIPYKGYFEGRGFRHVSIDLNGQDGALPLDLRKLMNLGRFDMVTNIGTSEHVEDYQEPVWRNIFEAVAINGVLVNMTPLPGEWGWHGFWYPKEEFFTRMAEVNGMEVERLYVAGESPRKCVYARLRRVEDKPFQFVDSLMFYNKGGKRYAWLT